MAGDRFKKDRRIKNSPPMPKGPGSGELAAGARDAEISQDARDAQDKAASDEKQQESGGSDKRDGWEDAMHDATSYEPPVEETPDKPREPDKPSEQDKAPQEKEAKRPRKRKKRRGMIRTALTDAFGYNKSSEQRQEERASRNGGGDDSGEEILKSIKEVKEQIAELKREQDFFNRDLAKYLQRGLVEALLKALTEE